METNYLLIKVDGKTTRFEGKRSGTAYLTAKEACTFIHHYSFDDLHSKIISVASISTADLVRNTNLSSSNYTIKNAMQELKDATNIDDIETIYKHLIASYKYNMGRDFIFAKRKSKKVVFEKANYPELVNSIMIKKIIEVYYEAEIKKASIINKGIKSLISEKHNGKAIEAIAEELNEHFPEVAHQTGIYNLALMTIDDEIEYSLIKSNDHLCGDCPNSCFFSCPKVKDIYKRPISKYSFITDGAQQMGHVNHINEGNTEEEDTEEDTEGNTGEENINYPFVESIQLVVTGCESYNKVKAKVLKGK